MAELTVEHLVLVMASMAVAIAVALPAGILLTRRAPLQRWVLGFANVMQTVPSLALFGFLIPIPLLGGIGKHTAIVALVLYALLPVLRNTLAGIRGLASVDTTLILAGAVPAALIALLADGGLGWAEKKLSPV
jgi:osmoprotectant transport system permease protein